MNKSVLCLLILIIGLALGMGAACASENLDTPASVDESSMEVENAGALPSSEGNALEESSSGSEEKSSNIPLDSKLGAPQSNPTLTAGEGTFTELQELINANNGGTLVLNKNYTYNDGFDKNGILITGSITIDGNNNVLDGKNLARIFNITGENVILKNIKFINGYSSNDGGAIYWTGANGVLSGSTFIGNSAVSEGGAVRWNGPYGVLSGSTFIGNSVKGSVSDLISGYGGGGAVYWWGANGVLSGSTFIGNSVNGSGGAVRWWGANGVLSGSNFISNIANAYTLLGYSVNGSGRGVAIGEEIMVL